MPLKGAMDPGPYRSGELDVHVHVHYALGAHIFGHPPPQINQSCPLIATINHENGSSNMLYI